VPVLTTFASADEYARAVDLLRRLGIEFRLISPEPAYVSVGCAAVVLEEEARARFLAAGGLDVMNVGWVDFREPGHSVPDEAPPDDGADLMGRVAIVLLAPCVADVTKLRLTAHLAGDATAAMPYLNAVMPQASYMANVPVLSFIDGHRMISLSARRISIAKADDVVDAWATLEKLRRLVNDVWSRRHELTPSNELRRRPSALEIYRRLPGTNCRACGQPSCTAFAWAVWRGDERVSRCAPVFAGERADLKDALLAICAGMGLEDSDA
jgi:ArsR family metal-binding transcriptional regulator